MKNKLHIYYFVIIISLPVLLFSSCKKTTPEVNFTSQGGKWYFEEYYVEWDSYYSLTNTYKERYINQGVIQFNTDGTGIYEYESAVIPFEYYCDEGNYMGEQRDQFYLQLPSNLPNEYNTIPLVYYTAVVGEGSTAYYVVANRTDHVILRTFDFNIEIKLTRLEE